MNSNSKPTYILGISCFYHDAAAALLKNGKLVAAAQEERFTRKKHDDNFPIQAINYCLTEAEITISDVSFVGFYDKPFLKFERILKDFIATWPWAYTSFIRAIPLWLKTKLFMRIIIQRELGYLGPIYFTEHHMSHAASSFFASPLKHAAIITVDGVGEWATASYGIGEKNKIELLEEIHYPHSLGMLYSIITYFLGFKPNDAEYKVMGLAPYGKPIYIKHIKKLITLHKNGSFSINTKILSNYHNLRSLERKLAKLFGFPKREAENTLEQHHKNLAASIQAVTNEAMVSLATHVQKETEQNNVCLAGGVALNCVSNYEIFKYAGFKNVFIQPAAGDAGGALGVAYYIWHQILGKPREQHEKHSFWGPSFDNTSIEMLLREEGIPYSKLSEKELLEQTASAITNQAVVGWFQGRMEWGPRALGARSILADPRNKENWQRVNLKIKFRESFRPFAPSVLYEKARNYFDFPGESPYMLFVAGVTNDTIPAVTHVDKTARLQTVHREISPLFYSLIQIFEKQTGCPVLINTSFNVRGEPIVCSPADALETFLKTDMDYLVMGSYLVDKKQCLSIANTTQDTQEKTERPFARKTAGLI